MSERAFAQRNAVATLNALAAGGDREADHETADEAVLACVPAEVREAYIKARDRYGFWYA